MTNHKDNGRAWVICFGAFIAFFLETGLVKTLGVLLPSLREEFDTHTWVIGLIISLMPGYGMCTCLLAGALRKRFSARVVLICYGLLSFIGIVCGSFATSLPILAMSIILTGFLFGGEAVTLAVLPDYFDRYFDTANVIVHLGLSSGIMVLPLLTQLLLDIYGWRGAMLIIGGLYLHLLVSASLIRPLDTNMTQISSYAKINLDEQHDVINDVQQNETELTPGSPGDDKYHCTRIIIDNLDLKLFKNFEYISAVLCLSYANGYLYTGWLIYLVPHSLDIGFQPYTASALATVGGVGNLVGTIGYLALAKVLSAKQIAYTSMLIASFANFLDPVFTLIHSYAGFMFSSFALNFGNALFNCVVFKIIVDIIDKDSMTNAINYGYAAYSLGSVSSGFVSGWLFDRFGNYTASFLLLGFVPLFTMIPLLIYDIFNYIKHRKSRP